MTPPNFTRLTNILDLCRRAGISFELGFRVETGEFRFIIRSELGPECYLGDWLPFDRALRLVLKHLKITEAKMPPQTTKEERYAARRAQAREKRISIWIPEEDEKEVRQDAERRLARHTAERLRLQRLHGK